MKVIKRDGTTVDFDRNKIAVAIRKANVAVEPEARATDEQIEQIIVSVESKKRERFLVEDIQDMVEQGLMALGKYTLAKAYIIYRFERAMVRQANTTDESVLTLIRNASKDEKDTKKRSAILASTQRDLIAGEVSKDLTRRLLLPDDVARAHESGDIHFHGADYFLQPIFNSCLVDIEDMLENGTVMNGTRIEQPRSFQVACTLLTQIIASVASAQYGAQSVDIGILGKYLRKSLQKFIRQLKNSFGSDIDDETIGRIAAERLQDELRSGVQTIQYQINTLMTTTGQAPELTLFMHIREDDEYVEENAMIFEEVLRCRYKGLKNERGVYITPEFPKLVYVLDECNCLQGGQYDHITQLAIRCTKKRRYPNFISAKRMREIYHKNVFAPIGAASFLPSHTDEMGRYRLSGRFDQGLVSINLPRIALSAHGNDELFDSLLDSTLEICKKALLCRHEMLKGTLSDVSPIHWQYGAISRLDEGVTVDKYLMDGYSTLSLGYVGLYETALLMRGMSHTEGKGFDFASSLIKKMSKKCDDWAMEYGLGFVLCDMHDVSVCHRFALLDRERFGEISEVTDKEIYQPAHHVLQDGKSDVLTILTQESRFSDIIPGGALSYAEIPESQSDLDSIEDIIKFIYENVLYAELNTRSDVCHCCGYEGRILLSDSSLECPICHNKDKKRITPAKKLF